MNESQSRTQIAGVPLVQFLLGCAATAFGGGLCVLLLHWSGAGPHWVDLLRGTDVGLACIALAGMAVNLLLAARKWCRVEACLAGSSPSYGYSVAMSAIGGAVGQLLPTPIANVIVRGVGNRASKRSGRHGALASAWEQLFDLAAATLLAGPAILALVRHQEEIFVAGLAFAAIAGEVGAVGVPRLLVRVARVAPELANPTLCRFLWRLSLARTAILMLVTVVIAMAMGAGIRPWWIASSVPAVMMAAVLSFLPAGIGVNELSFVGLLSLASVAIPTSMAFALVNRVLQIVFALVLGGAGVVLLAVRWGLRYAGHDPQRG